MALMTMKWIVGIILITEMTSNVETKMTANVETKMKTRSKNMKIIELLKDYWVENQKRKVRLLCYGRVQA